MKIKKLHCITLFVSLFSLAGCALNDLESLTGETVNTHSDPPPLHNYSRLISHISYSNANYGFGFEYDEENKLERVFRGHILNGEFRHTQPCLEYEYMNLMQGGKRIIITNTFSDFNDPNTVQLNYSAQNKLLSAHYSYFDIDTQEAINLWRTYIYHSEGALINILEKRNGRDKMFDVEMHENNCYMLLKERNEAYNQNAGYCNIYRYNYSPDLLNPFYNSKVFNNYTVAGTGLLSMTEFNSCITDFYFSKFILSIDEIDPDDLASRELVSYRVTSNELNEITSYRITHHRFDFANNDVVSPEFSIHYRD